MSEETKLKKKEGGGLSSTDLLVVNRRIQKQADDLGLKITNYEGFARGGWNGDEGYTPAGMWVFTVESSNSSKTTDHEPANIVAENLTDALNSMKEWAEYLFD